MNTCTLRQLKQGALVLAVSTLTLPSTAYSQTLEQAVAHTLNTNPEVRIAFNRFKAREEQVNQATAGYMPTVDISAGYGWEQTNSPGTRRRAGQGDVKANGKINLNRGEAAVSIKQILFDGFYTSHEVDRTRFEASAEQWALLASAEDIALEVVKVYINYIRSEQTLILAKKNLQSHQDIYGQIKQRTDSGLASTADLSQITGRLARANANVIAARNNFYDVRSQFVRIVEQQPQDMIVPVPDADMLPADLSTSIIIAQKNHPTLKSASSDIFAAKNEKNAVQSNYFPKVTLTVDGSWNNDTDGEDGFAQHVGGHNNDVVAMLKVNYNLFSGGKHLAREKETAYNIAEAKEIHQRAYRQVIEGVNLAWNAYELLTPQKMYIREHVVAAKETQVAYNQQFNLGQRTLLDLLDTENELFQARTDYLESEYNEIISQYRVLNATGQLLDSLKVTRPDVWQSEHDYTRGTAL